MPSSRPSTLPPSSPPEPDAFRIRGVTRQGKTFRPADWAERLCRVMSEYSSCVSTTTEAGVPCVVVHRQLLQLAPMAYEFLVNFARDNELQTSGLDEEPREPRQALSPPRAP